MNALGEQNVANPISAGAGSSAADDSGSALSVVDAFLRSSVRSRLIRGGVFTSDKERALDAACNEYYDRVEAGEAVELDSFCCRFPAIQYSLCRALLTQRSVDHLLDPSRRVVWPEIGAVFLGFLLHKQLGRGAFARVYLASELDLGERLVVLKVSPRQFGADEAHTLGRLRHAAIVPVHSVKVDSERGLSAVCMPILGTATLADLIDRRGAPPARPRRADLILDAARVDGLEAACQEAVLPDPILRRGAYVEGIVHLGRRLAEGLAAIHAQGVFHRDLKPSNVLLTPDGSPLLLDFNLSADLRQRQPDDGGTLAYMAPEALRNLGAEERPAIDEARADLYALGVVLYELLAGRHPFGPLPSFTGFWDARDTMLERAQRPPAELRELNPDVDRRLESTVLRCLAAEPLQRFGSAAELAHELGLLLSRGLRARRWMRAHAAACWTFALIGLSIAATAVATWAVQPTASERALRDAQDAYHAGDYEGALRATAVLTRAEPDKSSGWYLRGRTFLRLGERRLDALQDAEHAARSRIVVSRANEFAEAAFSFDQAYHCEPAAATLACKGYCLLRIGQLDAAADALRGALATGEPVAEIENDLGVAEMLARRLSLAAEHFDRAVALKPKLSAAWRNRALLASEKVGETADADLIGALHDIEQAIACGPATTEMYADALRIACNVAVGDPQCGRAAQRRYLEAALCHGLSPSAALCLFPKSVEISAQSDQLLAAAYPPCSYSRSQRILDPAPDSQP
jgi:serine/threonine protein kinase